MPIHPMVVAVMAGQGALEGAKEILVRLPAYADRVAADMAADVHAGIDPFQRGQRQLDPLFGAEGQHLQRVGHP